MGRAFVGVTPGIYDDELDLETVAARIDEITDEAGYIVPSNVDQEINLLVDFLRP